MPADNAKAFLFAIKKMNEHLDAAYKALEEGNFGEASHRGLSDASFALGRAAAELNYAGPNSGIGVGDMLEAEKRCVDFEHSFRDRCAFIVRQLEAKP